MPMIFICDDEEGILRYLDKIMRRSGYEVETFLRGSDMLKRLGELITVNCDAIFLDVRMSEMDGLQILKHLRKEYPNVPVIIMSGHGSIDDAVQAIKLGAWDYITKPFPKEKILEIMGEITSFRNMDNEKSLVL